MQCSTAKEIIQELDRRHAWWCKAYGVMRDTPITWTTSIGFTRHPHGIVKHVPSLMASCNRCGASIKVDTETKVEVTP